jgi:hypothetical protein
MVSAGAHSMAVTREGQLWGWGSNAESQLGTVVRIFRASPDRHGATGFPSRPVTPIPSACVPITPCGAGAGMSKVNLVKVIIRKHQYR